MCTSSTGTTPPYSPATRSVPQPVRETTELKLRWSAGALSRSETYPLTPPMSDRAASAGGVEDILDPPGRREASADAAKTTYRHSPAVGMLTSEARFGSHHQRPSTESIPRSEPYGQISATPPAGFVGAAPVSAPPISLRPGEKHAKPSRRSKAHVPAACGNCKKAHLACDIQRPCTRCVMTGKQATCRNVEHKKRGRPRLRDEREPKIEPPEGIVNPAGIPHAPIMPAPSSDLAGYSAHQRMESLRVLRSHSDRESLERDPLTGRPLSSYSDFNAHESRPVVFLSLNLTILRANRLFQDLFGSVTDGSGAKLNEFVDTRHAGTLHTLETDLRQERSRKDENYLPPISGTADLEAIQRLPEMDIERACSGFQIRSYQWSFLFPNGQSSTLQVTVRLAKTTAFFVVLTLPPLPKPEPRPIIPYTQHSTSSYPSPTSMHPFNFSQPPPGPYASPLPPSPLSSFQSLNTSLPPSSPGIYTHSMPPPLSRSLHPYPSYSTTSSLPGTPYQPSSSRTPEPVVRRESLQLPPIIGSSAPPMPPSRFAVSSAGRDHVGYPFPESEEVSDEGRRKRRRIYE